MVDRWGWCSHTSDVPNLLRAFNSMHAGPTSVPSRALRVAPMPWRRRSYATSAGRTSLKLRAQVDAILAMEPAERLRQLQAQSDLFASAVLVEDKARRWTPHQPR